jgi:hypothetical protein
MQRVSIFRIAGLARHALSAALTSSALLALLCMQLVTLAARLRWLTWQWHALPRCWACCRRR